MITRHFNLAGLVALGILTGCGGGGGDSGGSASGSIVSGYVVDGAVESSRVCYDMDGDNQCTVYDSYVTTNAEGYFEITEREGFQLIADVRHSESTDNDYASGSPDYDYVMQAFDQDREGVVISPLSTYMNYRTNIGGESEQEILSDVVSTIEVYEQYEYSEEIETTYEYSEIIQGNFVEGKNSEDAHLSDYNSRLHNINEVLAREMQESQAVWEDRFYSGEINLESTDWNDNSDVIVTNSYGTTFESFEIIVEEVTSRNFDEFNSREVSDAIWMDVPDTLDIQNLLDFMETQESVSQEFNGSTYRHSITSDFSSSVDFGYYVFSSEAISYYFESTLFGESSCFFASSPFSTGLSGVSESEFIAQLNSAFADVNAAGAGVSYSPLQQVSSPPANCSSLSNLLANFNTSTELSTASAGQLYQPPAPCVGTVDDQGICRPLSAVIVQGPSAITTSSLSSTNTAPATLNTCNYAGRLYATNPCRNTSKN